MNNFEKTFFKKYIPENQEVRWVIHEHWIKIVDNILLRVGLFVFVPSFMIYNSVYFQEKINFAYFEIYLIIIYLKLIYDIFNWYNDVFIITNEWLIALEWSLFKTKTDAIRYESIEWIWVEQDWIMDKLFNKWDVVIHKIWDEESRLVDAKVPYKALNEIEAISSAIKEEIQAKKAQAEKTKFELILDALWWVVEEYLWEKWLNPEDILQNSEKIKQKKLPENIILEEWTIDLRWN